MKKILLINNGLAGGGTERASVSLGHFFHEKGYQVTVLALYQSVHFYKLNDEIDFIEPSFDRASTSQALYLLKMLSYVRTNVKRIKPDTILSFNEWTNAYVILACLGLDVPIYVSERMHPKAKLPFLSEFLRRKLYRHANGVIAQTTYGKDIIQSSVKSKNVITIPNPVNVMEPVDVPKLNRVVAVGRLEFVKGHRFLVEAFSKVNAPDWELSLVGDGSERPNLEKQAKELGIFDRVIFHGHIVDFRRQLSEAKIYVLPSMKEGFPNSLIEAMSFPIACISGDYYGGKHDLVIDGENGLLVEPCNVDQLTSAIQKLVDNEELRQKLAENAKKVRVDLEFGKIANKYLGFIFSHKNNRSVS